MYHAKLKETNEQTFKKSYHAYLCTYIIVVYNNNKNINSHNTAKLRTYSVVPSGIACDIIERNITMDLGIHNGGADWKLNELEAIYNV